MSKLNIKKKPKNNFGNVKIYVEQDNRFIDNRMLYRYHNMNTKYTQLQRSNNVIYYVSEEDLNNQLKTVDDIKTIKDIRRVTRRTNSEPTFHKLENKQNYSYDSTDEKLFDSLLSQLCDVDYKNDNNTIPKLNNIQYDIYDDTLYDTFVITNKDDIITVIGMPPKSVSSIKLVSNNYIGKIINYELPNKQKNIFILYSTTWPNYKYPVYAIIHDYKCNIKEFIEIFNKIVVTIK